MPSIDVVCAACIHQGQVMIASRKSGSAKGTFEFPGGKIEPGETAKQAIVREWQEECGIQIENVTPLMESHDHQDGYDIHLYAFTCTCKERPVTPLVHEEFVWTTPDHIYDYPFFEADRALVEALQEKWKTLTASAEQTRV